MAITLNEVKLIGNVGKDPEIRTTQDGKEVAIFSLATSDVWYDKEKKERKEKTEWHKIVVFVSHLVSIVKNHVKKGSKLYICGSIQTRKWQDQTNTDKYTTEILLQSNKSEIIILSNMPKEDSHTKVEDDSDDDIPF